MPDDFFPPLPRGLLGDVPVTSGKFYNIEVYGNINAEGGTFDNITVTSGTFTNVDITGILNAEAGSDVDWSYISNVSIDNADINSLAFSKITAATNTASLTIGSSGYLQSSGYVAPSGSTPGTGFRINGDGSAVFNNINVYGTIYATSGEIGGLSIVNTLTLSSLGKIRTASTGQRWEFDASTSTQKFYDASNVLRTTWGWNAAFTSMYCAGSGSGTDYRLDGYDNLLIEGDGQTEIAAGAGTPDASSYVVIRGDATTNTIAHFVDSSYVDRVTITDTGQIWAEDGSTSTPAYSFQDDKNTGMYRYGADDIGFAAGGNLAFRMTISGDEVQLFGAETNDWYGINGASEQHKWYLNNVAEMILGQTGFVVPNVYSLGISGTTRDVYVKDDGTISYLTSRRDTKTDIRYAKELEDVELKPVLFEYKATAEPDAGFIVEDLAEQHPLLAVYDDDGVPVSYNAKPILAVLAAKINRLEEQMKGCTCHVI